MNPCESGILKFSVNSRQKIAQRLKEDQFDLLIVGGGITGAGIALDAASRGLKVALVEKNDFAYGTSSRSTKLIHGGLRYLKQLEFALVKEVGSERSVLHQLAPHLVVPEKMLLPLSEGKSMGYWLASLGLKIYDWLAGVKAGDRRTMLARSGTLNAEPLLNEQGIKGGALYAEYKTDDARFTIEVCKTAFRYGAHLLNYSEVVGFQYDTKGKIVGATIEDKESGELYPIKSNVVVNATGPWVDDVRKLDHTISGKKLHLTKGVHLVISRAKLPIKQAIYFEANDSRMIFAIPRFDKTYIGTTDTSYAGDKDKVGADLEDIQYLLMAVNSAFKGVTIAESDVESLWAGLRPLIHEEGKAETELSRKDEVFVWHSGLISIAGGKLTGYRKMAERVVDLVIERHPLSGQQFKDCFTSEIPLTESAFKDNAEVQVYKKKLESTFQVNALSHLVDYLIFMYGSQATQILNAAERLGPLNRDVIFKAELNFCYENEMIVSADDFLTRRTSLTLFDATLSDSMKTYVVKFLNEKRNEP